MNPKAEKRQARQRRSADFQPAVSPVSNRRAVRTFTRVHSCRARPTGSRRYSRLEACATSSARFRFGIRVESHVAGSVSAAQQQQDCGGH